MRLLDTTGGRCALAGGFRRQLLPGRFSSRRLTRCLLSTGHFVVAAVFSSKSNWKENPVTLTVIQLLFSHYKRSIHTTTVDERLTDRVCRTRLNRETKSTAPTTTRYYLAHHSSRLRNGLSNAHSRASREWGKKKATRASALSLSFALLARARKTRSPSSFVPAPRRRPPRRGSLSYGPLCTLRPSSNP